MPETYLRLSISRVKEELSLACSEAMVDWMRSSMRMAPSVPRTVWMKNPSNPPVSASATTKKPTPNPMPARLMIIERLRASRKRSAMRRLGDIRGSDS